ncbi:hypothetical protein [Streptomyces sp. NPDC086023]|uniref:hypothetical protein n=1 Tax=Streptomyces sp. NPDC086023 TaxID=3365746 RepID=UPI0037D14A1D
MTLLRAHADRAGKAAAAAGLTLLIAWLARQVHSDMADVLAPPIALWALMRLAGEKGNYALPYVGGLSLPHSTVTNSWPWAAEYAAFLTACAVLGWYDGWLQSRPSGSPPRARTLVRIAKATAAGTASLTLLNMTDALGLFWILIPYNLLITLPLTLWAAMRLAGCRKNCALVCVAGIAFPLGFAPLFLNLIWYQQLIPSLGFLALCALAGWYDNQAARVAPDPAAERYPFPVLGGSRSDGLAR